jgi:uncharacterized protein YcbK (DUF882 family)
MRRWGKWLFALVAALLAGTLPASPGEPPRERTIALYNIHTKELLSVEYMKAGRHVPEAMEKINWILRDFRSNEATQMDPGLIDLLWEVHHELGSAEPIHIISGYRSEATNDMLRRTVGGQARHSRHILGMAADVQFPDIPLKRLRYSALIRERGGVGYYPTSAIPFVHLDTDRVRAWPRLPRAELALLFPSGHTQHVPDDGEPITPQDVSRARTTHAELASEIAAFFTERSRARRATMVASLAPALPHLMGPPQPVSRLPTLARLDAGEARASAAAGVLGKGPRLIAGPTRATRARPADELAAREELRAFARGSTGFVTQPAFDDEHPDELSYRPFPIAPLLTETASADDPALARMVHPDLARTLEMLDDGYVPQLRLRPGAQVVRLLWAQEFKGGAIDLTSLLDADAGHARSPLADRRVATQAQ